MDETRPRTAPTPAAVHVPALMLGAAALLWGWHHSLLAYAVPAALAVECARLVPFRWDFDDTDFHRLGDVSGVGLVLLAVVQFSDHGLTGIYGVLRWFPLVVLGLVLAQLYSTRSTVKLSAMFLSVRYALKRGRITEPGELDMRLPLLVACMLSASAGLDRSPWLLPAQVALLGWLLWANRSRRHTAPAAVLALALVAAVAGAAAVTANATREALGPVIMDLVRERIEHWRDPFRSHTAMGDIGRKKVSDRIVARIESPPGIPVPGLLHEASYTHLSNTVWLAGGAQFEPLAPLAEGTRWDLGPDRRPFLTVTIAKSLIRNKGMLPVPQGAFRIDDLPVEDVHMSALGALKVLNGPALVRYRVRYAADASLQALPGDNDLVVPPRLAPLMNRTLAGMGVAPGTPPEAVASALLRHFADGFTYSLDLGDTPAQVHPLQRFLERERSGHCEFYATATVMLLRAAGVPARYATGYAVQEYSPLEQAWLVRRRHSHSWASAWIGGRWVDLDTTPSTWAAAEAEDASWWQPAYDLVSFLLHRFSRWRLERASGGSDDNVLLWLLLPLSLFLAWRVYRSRRVAREARGAPGRATAARAPAPAGTDSEFYRLEAMLARRGLVRPRECPPRAWLARLAGDGRLPPGGERWDEIVSLHYRLRFHPHGLDEAQRARLRSAVDQWLAVALARPGAPAPR